MNAALELAIRDWLLADPDLADITILTGQSAETIPGDQPVIVVGLDSNTVLVANVSKAIVSLVLATPCELEGGLDAHQSISARLHSLAVPPNDLADYFPATLRLAGSVLTSINNSISEGRWLCTLQISLGLVAEI